MFASDIMTRDVVSVSTETTVFEIARFIVERGISGLPVVDDVGTVVGFVTGADLLHRPELERQEHRYHHWLAQFFFGPEHLATDYIKACGLRAGDVMSSPAITIEEDTPVGLIASILEERAIKRVAVVRADKLVGIVSRTDLMKCILLSRQSLEAEEMGDAAILERLTAMLQHEAWGTFPRAHITIEHGTIQLRGVAETPEQAKALVVAAENLPGVRAVANHLHVVEPMHRYDLYGI
jgi:CBS domain-containing protein